MDDQGRQNLPNLKICVDNTEEGEISDSDDSSEAETAIDVDEKENDGNKKTTEVEFSVRIADIENKTKPKTEIYSKKYENRDGDFITGIDLTSKEALEKKEERAKRFGIEVPDHLSAEVDIKGLYSSLGLKEEDFNRGERGVRPEAIHMRGTDNMSTQDVFRYFREFAPGGIEWIDDASCNAVWADPMTAARAMLKLSDSYETLMEDTGKEKKVDKRKTDKGTDVGTKVDGKKEKEDSKSEKDETETEMEVEEYDDELDLVGDGDKTEDKMKEDKDTEAKKEKKSESDKDKSDSEEESSRRKDEQLDIDESREEEKHMSGGGDGSDERQKRRERRRIPWPPGKWRLGHEKAKSQFVFLRFATKADKKLPRAESRSKYYMKYGNPNYGGMRGLISNSRKRRYRAKTYEEELAETKAAIESQRAAREAKERGDLNPDDFHSRVSPLKRKRDGSGSEGEELDMEAELQELLGPPVRKQRSMRMYADDEEEKSRSKRRLGGGSSGVMTVVAGRVRQPIGRVKDARELIQRGGFRSKLMMDQERDSSPESVSLPPRSDLRMRIRTSPSVSGSDEESEEEQEESSSESEDLDRNSASRPSVMSRLGPAGRASGESDSDSQDSDGKFSARLNVKKPSARIGSDLRSRLGGHKGPSENRKYPSMRIEVFD